MSRFNVTPWQTRQDLLDVRRDLYQLDSDAVDNRRQAVDRVLAWKLRSGSLPHAVESTALLVDALLNHASSKDDTSLYSVRAVYTAAFTRFVTGFCDIGRARERSLDPSSMLEISRQIGMPSELVALRHEATHEDLPGIRRLVAATEQSLAWLWNVYWNKLGPTSEKKVNGGLVQSDDEQYVARDDIRGLFKEYRKMRLELLRNKQAKTARGTAIKQQEALTQQCADLLSNDLQALHVLVQDKLLFPTNRALSTPLDGAFMIWNPLLARSFAQSNAVIERLVTELLKSFNTLNDTQDVESEALLGWLVYLSTYPEGRHTPDDQIRVNSRAVINAIRVKIVQSCCLHPREWSQKLGQAILETSESSIIEDWKMLLDASRIQLANGENAVQSEMGQFDAEAPACESRPAWTRMSVRPVVPVGVVYL